MRSEERDESMRADGSRGQTSHMALCWGLKITRVKTSCDIIDWDESRVYYQTEIFDQLPSSLARRTHHHQDRGTTETSHPVEMHPGQAGGARDRAPTQPIRSLPVCMQRKREARFGVGVKAYFVFLRYLVYLNLLQCLVIGGTILTPTAVYDSDGDRGLLRFEGNDSVLDFFVERSPVFYGFYACSSLDLQCLNTPLLFLLGTLTVLILSLVMVVHRTVVGYKHTWLLGNHYNIHMSYKVFCGWDFCIHDPEAAAHKLSFIRNELKLYLEEERFQQREARRTLGQWAHLYSLRGLLHFLVLVLLGGACWSHLSIATLWPSQAERVRNVVLSISPIVITLVNFFLPHVFRHIASFEDHSLTTQEYLPEVGQSGDCWENQFGKEMYKLSVFDFLACFCNTFFIAYPRKWLVERYPSSWLARLSGKQHFLIPFNVLDLVYSQTVTWVGLFYCPLLPYIEIVKLVAIFYIKKLTVLQCCVPAQRMFRASSSSVLFHFMLLLGLIMAAITLGSNLHHCGPFVGSATVFNVTDVVVLTTFESRRRANGKAIERLKDMLCTSDKHFLLKQHTLSLRRQKKTFKAPTTASQARLGLCLPNSFTHSFPDWNIVDRLRNGPHDSDGRILEGEEGRK
ncbi:unnamed protein product, partial [Coregonus sp. 'balchen']